MPMIWIIIFGGLIYLYHVILHPPSVYIIGIECLVSRHSVQIKEHLDVVADIIIASYNLSM